MPCPERQTWQQFLADTLPPLLEDTLGEHLRDCADCRGALERLSDNQELHQWACRAYALAHDPSEGFQLRRALEGIRPTPADRLARMNDLMQPAEVVSDLFPTQIPGYEILGELGRGGMGVVYRARHRGLNREVAIKMISPECLRTEESLRRFRAEAELAAALDHSGIIPVYEVGDYEGRPFFAMKLVEGGGLSHHLGRLMSDRRAAVHLLAHVARAVHYAHQHGVLHRDLKPANILLDRQGAPVVSDFGLAKRLDGGTGLSATGTVLGTPSYMAPEQMADSKGVTTAADVYGLGAIMFELLTGRPPFRADEILETLRQVKEELPPRPRSLDSSIDPVLELICLKCLEKDPQKRYGSAEALAGDLERWLVGDPVSIRPPTLTALLRAWARQNFGSAGWTVVGGAACGLATKANLRDRCDSSGENAGRKQKRVKFFTPAAVGEAILASDEYFARAV
jgi:serine/threonine-protein kinase